MNNVETVELESRAKENGLAVQLPLGLLGFERIKDYELIENPDEWPFRWLQVVDIPSLAFLVLPPTEVIPGYTPEITDEDAEFLGLSAPEEAWVLSIVTLDRNGHGTVNLRGPIIINRHTRTGKQVVLANAAHYSVQHPLPVTH